MAALFHLLTNSSLYGLPPSASDLRTFLQGKLTDGRMQTRLDDVTTELQEPERSLEHDEEDLEVSRLMEQLGRLKVRA